MMNNDLRIYITKQLQAQNFGINDTVVQPLAYEVTQQLQADMDIPDNAIMRHHNPGFMGEFSMALPQLIEWVADPSPIAPDYKIEQGQMQRWGGVKRTAYGNVQVIISIAYLPLSNMVVVPFEEHVQVTKPAIKSPETWEPSEDFKQRLTEAIHPDWRTRPTRNKWLKRIDDWGERQRQAVTPNIEG